MHTEIGRIASLTQELEDEKSPLQREIETITRVITVIAVAMGVLFFFLGTFVGKLSLAAAFLFTIGIIVANVPEGLLPTVTLSLAMAVQRMARRNVLIKRLSSVETLGCTTVICTDKTGTLTTGEITVTKIWINGKLITVGGDPHEPMGTFTHQGAALSHEEMERSGLYRCLRRRPPLQQRGPPSSPETRRALVRDRRSHGRRSAAHGGQGRIRHCGAEQGAAPDRAPAVRSGHESG